MDVRDRNKDHPKAAISKAVEVTEIIIAGVVWEVNESADFCPDPFLALTSATDVCPHLAIPANLAKWPATKFSTQPRITTKPN